MRAFLILLLLACVRPAAAQVPDAPETPPADRVAVSLEVTGTFGSHDPGFFNYATYDYSPLRNVRTVLDTSLRATRHLSLLAQVRTDGYSHVRLMGLYLRVRPWQDRNVDLQVGRVPPTFGLFGATGYGVDNPLIGRPLAYGYLTSLRRDALPATAADLVRMRGRGWLTQLPLGNPEPDRGLPLIDTEHWDTGIQTRVAAGAIEWVGSVTTGSLASPRVRDDNDGRSLSTRLVVRPHPGIAVGASGARGAYLARSLDDVLPANDRTGDFHQSAAAVDVDLSAGRWQLRGEAMRAWWDVAAAADAALEPALTSTALWGEARVRVLPGFDVAVRGEHLDFGDIAASFGPTPWEAPVTRVEAGVSVAVHRHVRVKAAWQHDRRPLGGRVRRDDLVAGQLAVWF